MTHDTKPTLRLIGGGMGDPALLTGAAREALCGAAHVYAPPRMAESFSSLRPDITAATVTEICAALAQPHEAAVLVSGDVGFHSLAGTLCRELGDQYELQLYNGVSSLQYLCGKLRVPYDDIKTVSLHGKPGSLLGIAAYHRRVFCLTGGKGAARALLEELAQAGPPQLRVVVGEALSQPGERIRRGSPADLAKEEYGELVALLLDNPEWVNPLGRLKDEEFERGEVPMTKESVRCLSVARLAVQPTDTVWDIGAGTGSVSVALGRAAREGVVFAVECDPQALALLRRNRLRLGAYNVRPVDAKAPNGLETLALPDKLFIGGGGAAMEPVLRLLTERSNAFSVCVNTITMESTAMALGALDGLGFADVEVECVNVARARQTGRYRMMTAQNPVHILSGRWQR